MGEIRKSWVLGVKLEENYGEPESCFEWVHMVGEAGGCILGQTVGRDSRARIGQRNAPEILPMPHKSFIV